MKHSVSYVLFLLLISGISVIAQPLAQNILHKPWKASWIQVPGEPANGYGVYLFRKKIHLLAKPGTYRIHVSGDNRYKLYVNEKMVSLGPARSDVHHWNFETVDIAPLLNEGDNIIAGIVWNEAEWRPEAQISFVTGFIVQGATEAEQLVNTDTSWKCIRDNAYLPLPVRIPNTYYVAGPGEIFNMAAHPRNWKKIDFDDASWKNARVIVQGNPKSIMGAFGIPVGWLLTPSILPQMEQTPERIKEVRKADGITIPPAFPSTKTSLTVPANTTATILLDQGHLTNAYTTVIFSGGKNAAITLGYAETLYTRYPAKGNRNETEGKEFVGRKDSIISDGSAAQEFSTLNWRTYRYLQLRISTKQEPLMLDDIYGTFTGYPFTNNANFESDDPELDTILATGWRTARLCAVETYMDCPYYEQLQYIADTRIQAMISLYNSGDDRLIKNAFNLMDQSRTPEGVTESRHPSYSAQFIPTFTLWYIGMMHDYWMYGKDTSFIKTRMAGARQVLDYFHKYQRADGSLINVPYWMFTDWVQRPGWVEGIPPSGEDSSSSIIDLQLLLAYQAAADMEQKSGMKEYAMLYNKYAAQLKSTIRKKYWDHSKGLFSDRPEKDMFSQHANALAILTGTVQDKQSSDIANKLLSDTSLAPASIYFKYYLHLALIKAGMGNDYTRWLDVWRENLKMGLTTWGESPDINLTRSDCHAWGSSPNIELFRTVLGIDSDAPGFTKVIVRPHPGPLTNLKGEIPHPRGKIAAAYTKTNNQWTMNIELPEQTRGTLIWKNKSYSLKPGKNQFTF